MLTLPRTVSLSVSSDSRLRLHSVVLLLIVASACQQAVHPFGVAFTDTTVVGKSRYPVASDLAKVGRYAGRSKSGGGYFYDEVLEYRVWLHPERGATPRAGDEDYYAAFAQYERAAKFARATKGAEMPLVLVRQRESIDEPTPGYFEWVHKERITEWKVAWLAGSVRHPDSIARFLAARKQPRGSPGTTTPN